MRAPRIRGAVVHGSLAAVLLLAATAASAPAAHRDHRGHPGSSTGDLVASAHPSAGRPVVRDVAVDFAVLRGRSVEGQAAATSSATCTDCTAESAALQVLYVDRARGAGLDNTATAWTQECSGCSATALSLQVTVLRGVPSVVANNRAIAVNAASESSRATSAAYQLVVAAERGARLPRGTVVELRTWLREQMAVLREAPSATPSARRDARPDLQRRDPLRREAATGLAELEELVTSAIPVETVSSEVEVSR